MPRVGRLFSGVIAAQFGSFQRRPVRASLLSVAILTALVALGAYGWAVNNWRRARDDFDARRFREAGLRLEQCRRIWPDDPDVILLSAKTCRRNGDFDSAQAYLVRYFALRPGSREEAQVEFLLLRVQSGDDEAVEPLFGLVEGGHPDSAAILETISLSYMRQLRYQAANASLSKWIELHPDQALPYDWRGLIYERTSSPALAHRDYLKALELDPGLIPVRLRLVELLLEEKKVPEVTPHIDVLFRSAPERVDVKARVGMLRFLEGDSAEARRLLEEVEPELARTDTAPLVYLARLDVQEGRGADAERRLRRVIALDPTESDARFVLVTALRLQGREADALVAEREQKLIRARTERVSLLLRDRADKSDATADEWYEIGSLLAAMQMDARAGYWLAKVLARDPDHQGAHRELMSLYERKGDTSQAAGHRRMLRDR